MRADDGQRHQQPDQRRVTSTQKLPSLSVLDRMKPADQRDRDHDADRGGQEVLHRQAGHLDQVAHGRLAGVVLPVRVGHERGGGVPGQRGRHVGHAQRQQQVVLQPLKPVQEQHADERRTPACCAGRRPLLVGRRGRRRSACTAALDPPVLVGGEDVGHVVAQRLVAGGQGQRPAGRPAASPQERYSSEPLRQDEGHEQIDGQHDAGDQADQVLSAQSAQPPSRAGRARRRRRSSGRCTASRSMVPS